MSAITDQDLLDCLFLENQTPSNNHLLGPQLGENHYIVLCHFTAEKIADVADAQLDMAVAHIFNHMQSLQKTELMFDCSGSFLHFHTLEFLDKLVKKFLANHSLSITNIFIVTGMLAHKKNVEAYTKFCQDNNFTRLNLVFSSGDESLLNLKLSDSNYSHPAVNLSAVLKSKKFACFESQLFSQNIMAFDDNAIELDSHSQDIHNMTLAAKDFFENSYFTVSSELNWYDPPMGTGPLDLLGFSFRIFTPIAFRHPFILLDRPGSLAALRDMGFKTFSPFINENYDSIVDDHERFVAICDEIERLSGLSDQEWLDVLNGVQETVNDNYDRLAMKMTRFVFESEVDRLYGV